MLIGRSKTRGVLYARSIALALFTGAAFAPPAQADSVVQITPVLLDLTGPSAVGVVNFGNQSQESTTIQVRVFKWRQSNGRESLEPTEDVVVSPPKAEIAAGATLSIRVVRTAQAPITGEDSYRLVIDQLPQARDSGRAMVAMLLRQVLPLFFASAERSNPSVAWSIARVDGKLALLARNGGDRRLRVSKVTLTGSGGGSVTLGGSLLGYVLGHSQMSWTIPAKSGSFAVGSRVSIHPRPKRYRANQCSRV